MLDAPSVPQHPLAVIDRRAGAWALVFAGCVAYLALAPATPDLAAQVFRADLFRFHGPSIYNTAWYGGHGLVSYSVLSPPLEALIGPRLVGVLSTLASVVLFQRLVGRGVRSDLCTAWFSLTALANLFVGRMPFALGMALGLATLLVARKWGWWAAPVAVASALASPLAGAFLGVVCVAWALTARRPAVLGAAAAALATVASVQLVFPEGGTFPFPPSTLALTLVSCVVIAVAAGARRRSLQAGALLYALAATAAWAVPSSMGGNVTRFGAIFAGPALAYAAWPRRRLTVLVAAPLLLVWTLQPLGSDLSVAASPSASPTYYSGLLRFLKAHGATRGRVEIPFTREHWETVFVAPRFPLARGWERQLDRRYNALFYERGALNARSYVAWLHDTSVRYVALSDGRLDAAAVAEAAILRRGLPELRPVWHDRHWRVWAVRHPTPIVSGAARLVRLGPSSITLRALRPGVALVRLHFTSYWSLPAGAGCVMPSPGGWTRIVLRRGGTVTASARLSVSGLLGAERRCY